MTRWQSLILLLVFSVSQASLAEGQVDTTPTATKTFRLQDILTLALERNPLVEEGQGVIEQKEGDALAASAYPNPTISVQGGRGSVRDPSTSTSITERYITLSQPLEWPSKRTAPATGRPSRSGKCTSWAR